jgi:hypothetical protein
MYVFGEVTTLLISAKETRHRGTVVLNSNALFSDIDLGASDHKLQRYNTPTK